MATEVSRAQAPEWRNTERINGLPAEQRFPSMTAEKILDTVLRDDEEPAGGKHLRAFEQNFTDYTGAKHVFGVSNGVNALRLAAIFCHIHPGDEVIISALGGYEAALAFGDLGATIVWSDAHPDTWTPDPDDIARKITPKTKAVVVVHPYGYPCEIARIVKLAHEQGLLVVEDCGAGIADRVDGSHIGTHGDFGCFRLDAEAPFAAFGGAGVLVCKDAETAKHIPVMRSAMELRGDALPAAHESVVLEDRWPQEILLGEVQSAFASEWLRFSITRADTIAEGARVLRERLAGIPEVSFPCLVEGAIAVPYGSILCYNDPENTEAGEELFAALKRLGLQVAVLPCPPYQSPLLRAKGFGGADCPVLERLQASAFMFYTDGANQEAVCEAIEATVQELRSEQGTQVGVAR